MADRNNHYEAAFEAYLRTLCLPYIPSEENRRSRLADGTTIKNLDFIVTVPGNQSWLVDVKGRRFPGGRKNRSYWKQWATHDDLAGMHSWETLFGRNFSGLFVFAYQIIGNKSPLPVEKLFPFQKKLYAFVGIRFSDYMDDVRLISPRWNTYSISTRQFRMLAQPFDELVKAKYF
ncbi:MAG: HYExAFE family protein [Planctomycetaceae bacterium]|nr:HYExAFE family protein [Planctomycetaceae bacterium]